MIHRLYFLAEKSEIFQTFMKLGSLMKNKIYKGTRKENYIVLDFTWSFRILIESAQKHIT